jgi:hypothetical protein
MLFTDVTEVCACRKCVRPREGFIDMEISTFKKIRYRIALAKAYLMWMGAIVDLKYYGIYHGIRTQDKSPAKWAKFNWQYSETGDWARQILPEGNPRSRN